jgi:DsbC/DsbD-like thiol-disulfide interchange protein
VLHAAAPIEAAATAEPTSDDPVVVTASLLPAEQDGMATLVIDASIMRGWHIYAYVSGENPFIQTETLLELPEGASAGKDWETSAGIADPAHEGVVTYEDKASFKMRIDCKKVKPDALIKCGLYYQVCDLTKCFPPQKKMVTLQLKTL